jgi:hypothetical protein
MSWNTRGSALTHNPPFVVNVQVDPQLNDFIPLFTGYTLDCILQMANKNDARQLFKELMEQDQNALQELVQALANVVEFYVFSENLAPNQVEVAIRNAVEPVVNNYLALAVNAYPQEFGPHLTADQVADVQNYIREFEDIKFQAQRFFHGGQQQSGFGGRGSWQPQGRGNQGGGANRGGGISGWNRGGGNAGGRVSHVQQRSRWDEPGQDQGGGYVRSHQDNWPGNRETPGGGRGNWSQNQNRNTGGRNTIWDDTGVNRKPAATDTSFNSTGGGRMRRQFEEPRHQQPVREERRTVVPTHPNAQTVDGVLFIPARANNEWPKIKDPKRIWDHILMQDGTQLRPAYQSDWKVSFDVEEPLTPWYDPETHILFHYKSPEGSVSMQAIQREESMNYLDHELDPDLRRKGEEAARAREGKLAPAWQMVETLRPNPSQPLATAEPLSDDAEGASVELVNPDAYLVTTSLSDAIKRSNLRLKVDCPEVLKQAFELYVDRGVLTTIVNPDFQEIYKLTNADSFKSLFHQLNESKDEELVREVDSRMVSGINTALQQNLGLNGWTISNFREDYGDLVVALKEDHGDIVLQTFEGYATEVISRALAHYSKEDLDETVRKVVGLEGDIMALVWLERSSVTRLPVSSEELRVPVDTGVLISQSRFPEIYKTLDSIFERTTDLPHTFHGRYLTTTDGVVYSITKGYLNDQAILLFKAPFNLQ